MNTALESLGLIAGNRSLPLEFARQARNLGVRRLVAVAFEGETDPALASLVDNIVWVKVGQLSKMIGAFTERGVKQCVMAGQTVVVKNGTVLAVEGFEGTDACLARGGELAGKNGGGVAVKVARANHDMRFD